MASSNNRALGRITPLVIKFLVFLALIDNVALADVSERYHVVKNQQNVKVCANTTTTPGKTVKMVRSPIACSGKCSSEDQCVGFNYRPSERVCELFDHPGPTEFCVMEGCSYYFGERSKDPANSISGISGGKCSFPYTYNGQLLFQCVNVNMYNQTGWNCLTGNRSVIGCDDNVKSFVAEYHLVNISIPTFPNPVLVNSINSWIIIHQKLDDTTDFNLYWADYKAGFGIPGGNFWIGLERMHQMTSTTPYRLRIEVQSSYNNLWYSAEYDTFLIDSEAGGYAIHVTGYHGDAGDAMQSANPIQYQNGMKFSTRDVDNDLASGTPCAIGGGTANWYNACYAFLLTGSSEQQLWGTLKGGLWPYIKVCASRMLIQKY